MTFHPKQEIFTIRAVIRAGWDLLGGAFDLTNPFLFTICVCRITEQFVLEGTFKDPLFQPPAMDSDMFH